ncbi:MAG: methylmalonyl-CoA carboxyltransferase subunit [Actinomycetota bacterium]|nr:methylmalonyl-CoA carboxyltransferase subunit [Actinomycetota bacterium]
MSTEDTAPTTAELLARIDELTRRVEWLEASLPDGPRQPTTVPPDVVMAISAAVAAYLGERAKVRQIRLSGTPTWTQQGRASVMGSHTVTPGRRHALR